MEQNNIWTFLGLYLAKKKKYSNFYLKSDKKKYKKCKNDKNDIKMQYNDRDLIVI